MESETESGGSVRARWGKPRVSALTVIVAVFTLIVTACGGGDSVATLQPGYTVTQEPNEASRLAKLRGRVEVDGSSTVYLVTEAVAEEFRTVAPAVRVTVGVSGTGGGFKRFCAGETDISNASRAIKDKEKTACVAAGVNWIQLQVGLDGLAVVVNGGNDFIDYLAVEELKRIWEPGSKVNEWSQVRPSWPDKEIVLFGPGTDSGTFDYFTEAIVGEEDASRSDFQASEDDNVLVTGVSGEKYSLGYFGYAYFAENMDKLKAVAIDSGDGNPVAPMEQTINDGSYRPLSRPLFIYVNLDSLENKPQVRAFVEFYLENAPNLVPQVGYVPMPQPQYDHQLATVGEQNQP